MQHEAKLYYSLADRVSQIKSRAEPVYEVPWPIYTESDIDAEPIAKAAKRVADAMEYEDRQRVSDSLCLVVADGEIEPDALTTGLALTWPDGSADALFPARVLSDSSFDGLCWLVCHEVRHVWQARTKTLDPYWFKRFLIEAGVRSAREEDANRYAQSLGFVRDPLLTAQMLGYPSDASFKTILDRWPTLTTEQKQQLAGFVRVHALEWPDLCEAIGLDARLLNVAHGWQYLADADRNTLEKFVTTHRCQS